MKTKQPTLGELNQLGVFSFFINDIRDILEQSRKKYGHRRLDADDYDPQGKRVDHEKWRVSNDTLELIKEFFIIPSLLDATPRNGFGAQESQIEEHMTKVRTEKAIRWSKLFADWPKAMIDALPKINKLLEGRNRTPRQTVICYYAERYDIQRHASSPDAAHFCERFWTDEPALLAQELRYKLANNDITPEIIELARSELRELLHAPPSATLAEDRR
ncbi:MAG TPA: hypothetical protein VMF08_04445 [Candidatus Sulfotelmatobacter sp.]|nr:hypothetical protein [Candidatus Sulfotelmatobacter sp.]